MKIDLEKLKELAANADTQCPFFLEVRANTEIANDKGSFLYPEELFKRLHSFYNAANPQTILKLIELIEDQNKEIKELEDKLGAQDNWY